ncbi:MAG: tetratricopeptide repeat protein, partial [Spirochaetaceae bacterium]|nr:tetratricopeptide repeat protein [Spirochaetaceae bacterium]
STTGSQQGSTNSAGSLNDEQIERYSEFPKNPTTDAKTIPVSRTAYMNQNMRLRVVYPGEKWVFLGEQTAQKGLPYEQRKFQNGDTEFTFLAKEQGHYILQFSRYDAYTNSFIEDALAVEVAEKRSGSPAYTRAPAYTLPTSPNPSIETLKPSNETSASTTLTQTTQANPSSTIASSSTTKNTNYTDLLEQAKSEIAMGNAGTAIDLIQQFVRATRERNDEAYFYLGQAYELNGNDKNIKEAYKAYSLVTNAYPDSEYWQKSDERIRYIKRFFVNIE